MQCTKCNRIVNDKYTFCPTCGTRIEDCDKTSCEELEFIICPQCKVEYPYSIDHCTQCGHMMKKYKERIEAIEKKILEDTRVNKKTPHCPRCGSSFITAGPLGTWGLPSLSNRTRNRCANCGYSWIPKRKQF